MLWERRPGWQKHKVATEGKRLAPAIAAAWESLWSIAAIDARPLLLGFSLCAGVVAYVSELAEPPLSSCLLINAVTATVIFIARRIWWLSFVSLPAPIGLGVIGGFTAGAVRAATVAAPVIPSETRPLMLEGWVKEVEPGTKCARLRIEVHALSGRNAPAQATAPGCGKRTWRACDQS